MGNCSTKKSSTSVDVSGNNNYVLLINGVQVSFASVLDEITDHIDTEVREAIVIICSICVLMTLLLIALFICLLLPMRTKYRRTEHYIMMRNIEHDIIHLNESIQNLSSQTDQLSLVLLEQRSNWRSKNSCVDEYTHSLV